MTADCLDQVYNNVGRGSGQLNSNSDAFRRLTRRIHHNIGLLNTSRSSNHSSSFRMPRTQLSSERYNTSRDHSQHSNHGYNPNYNRPEGSSRDPAVRRDSSHRRVNHQVSRPYPTLQNRGKHLVENLYMLAGNQKQYEGRRQQCIRGENYESQSPRTRNYLPVAYQQKRQKRSSKDRQSGRYALPSRESRLLMNQRSKDKDRKAIQMHRESSRDRNRKYFYAENNQKRIDEEEEMRKIYVNNRQNIYELKSPNKRVEKRRSEKEDAQKVGKTNSNSTKNMNLYYFQQKQISSTSGGTEVVKTIQSSKIISQASLPVHSIASHKDITQKESMSPRVHQKNSLRIDRSKERLPLQSRAKIKEKQQESEKQQRPQMNKLSVMRKTNSPALSKKQVLKGKQKNRIKQEDVLLLGSVFLPMESKRQEGRQWAQDILERIILHLECLNIIADYTKQFRKMYENTQQWQTLIFLSYKKFYIERTKVEAILKAPPIKQEIQESRLTQGTQNPFCFPYSKVSEEQLCRFRGSRECLALRQQLQTENTKIRNALRSLYNLYIEKSGDHVNMFDCDNFSEEIFRLMLEEVEGISENLEQSSLVEITKIRLGKIIRTGLLIAFINGKYVKNFAQVLLHEDIIKIGKRETLREDCSADMFLGEFKRVLS